MSSRERALDDVLANWKTALKDKELAIASAILGCYLIVHLPPAKQLVGESKWFEWFDLNFLMPIILTLILWQTVEITRRLIAVEGGIQSVSGDIYTVIHEAVKKVEKKQHRTLDVLGLTLRDGWNWSRGWIEQADLDGWTIRLSACVPSEEADGWCPASWPESGNRHLSEIAKFGSTVRAKRAKVTLLGYRYGHTPPVHGYKLGNGDIYMAYTGWTAKGKVTGLNPRYEYIPQSDKSPKAKAKRAFFEAWLRASQRHPSTGEVR